MEWVEWSGRKNTKYSIRGQYDQIGCCHLKQRRVAGFIHVVQMSVLSKSYSEFDLAWDVSYKLREGL